MASSIEDILYAKALAEASAPDMGVAVGVGATGGALAGLIPGDAAHKVGNVGRALTGRERNRFITGNRFAGGLVGAILGGALGAGVRDSMIRSSPQMQRVLAEQEINGML